MEVQPFSRIQGIPQIPVSVVSGYRQLVALFKLPTHHLIITHHFHISHTLQTQTSLSISTMANINARTATDGNTKLGIIAEQVRLFKKEGTVVSTEVSKNPEEARCNVITPMKSKESKDEVHSSPTSHRELDDIRKDDPFLYFSCDKRRLEYLLGTELPHMTPDEKVTRKTRISFELDPSFDLVNSFPELMGEFDDKSNSHGDDALKEDLDVMESLLDKVLKSSG